MSQITHVVNAANSIGRETFAAKGSHYTYLPINLSSGRECFSSIDCFIHHEPVVTRVLIRALIPIPRSAAGVQYFYVDVEDQENSDLSPHLLPMYHFIQLALCEDTQAPHPPLPPAKTQAAQVRRLRSEPRGGVCARSAFRHRTNLNSIMSVCAPPSPLSHMRPTPRRPLPCPAACSSTARYASALLSWVRSGRFVLLRPCEEGQGADEPGGREGRIPRPYVMAML